MVGRSVDRVRNYTCKARAPWIPNSPRYLSPARNVIQVRLHAVVRMWSICCSGAKKCHARTRWTSKRGTGCSLRTGSPVIDLLPRRRPGREQGLIRLIKEIRRTMSSLREGRVPFPWTCVIATGLIKKSLVFPSPFKNGAFTFRANVRFQVFFISISARIATESTDLELGNNQRLRNLAKDTILRCYSNYYYYARVCNFSDSCIFFNKWY